ncbi:hypothetical protein DYB34_004656 [Aphanomyces astaci]|uniref:WW domain-containing protein n=1 Tax=Aphanomyces astaci TaxID=112090 RepID=A0A3R6VTD1_APHAT|nr:hypothetical protein DYB34_004656 [Aphanomyces astaci]
MKSAFSLSIQTSFACPRSILFGDEGRVMGLTPSGDNLPVYEFNATFSGYSVPNVYFPFHRPNTSAGTPPPSYTSRDMMRPTTISKPSRAIKSSHQTHALTSTPNIIFPSKLYRDSLQSSHRPRPFVMPPDYMLDMLKTNQMPLSLPFSTSFAKYPQLQSIAFIAEPTTSREQVVPYNNESKCIGGGRTHDEEDDNNLDINSVAYKRRRLLAILHAPIDSTSDMQALAIKEHTTIMTGFSLTLHQLHDDERSIMTNLSQTILEQRNQLPLKFLFELPGGIGYCRDRLQTSMALWVEEFEVNQQRAAWLQWKALVETFRFKDRMGDFVRQAALKRMRLAMDLMVKAFVHKGWVKWVFTTQIDIWYCMTGMRLHFRDRHARKIQPHVRRHFAKKAFLASHDVKPVGGCFTDMFLAPPRPNLPFQIPLRVRLERRQLWFAAIAVQAPYRGRRFRKFMRTQRLAATKIQAASRRRQARLKYVAARAKIIRLQAHIRRHLARKAFVRLRNATVMVQRNLRGRMARQFVRLVVLATRRQGEWRWQTVQPLLRLARGYLARQQARAIRAYHANRLRSALLIQKAWYTYNNEWATFLLLGCLREREVDEKRWERDLHLFHRHQSASRIQTEFRAFVANQRHTMALRIQLAYRCHVARRALARLKARVVAHRRIKWWFRAHHARRHRLATRIQYWWRKAVPGRMLRHLAYVAKVVFRVLERRNLQFRACATQIQRMYRGQKTRQSLAEHWRWLDERTRMARRVQRLWRQTADKRFAKRLLALQRRRVANPFTAISSLSAVVDTAIEKSLVHFDPYDPLVGLTLIGWLRRLGLDEYYDVLYQHGITDEFLQSTCQIKDKDTKQLFLTGMRYRQWQTDVVEQRKVVAKLEKAAARLDAPFQKALKGLREQQAVVLRWQHKAEKAQAEATEFAHPPKAVRRKLQRAQVALAAAESALEACVKAKGEKEAAAGAAKDKWMQAKANLKPMEANEIKAVFIRQAATYVDSAETIKTLFLDYFPNMDFRAVRFVESLHDKPVTLAQLVRFFGRFTTISDVKFNTALLTTSPHDAEIATHEHKRLQLCTDILQFAVERCGDLLHVPILGMIDPRQAPSDLSSSVLTVVQGLQQTRSQPLPERPLTLRICLAELLQMEACAMKVQRLWRTRQGRHMAIVLRDQQLRSHLAESYAAERNRQNVRKVWEDDLKKAQAMLQARTDAAREAELVAALSMTLRFGYSQEWDDDHQAWYYMHMSTGEKLWDRPSFNRDEFKAVHLLQRLVRRYLGKCRRVAYKRSLDRWAKYERDKVVWDAQWMDRKRFVTLRIGDIQATTPATIVTWRHDSSHPFSRSALSKGAVLPAIPSTADTLNAWTTLLEQAYHKSVRKDHLTHMLLPVYARPPNAHAAATLEFLRLFSHLRDALRPTGSVKLSMAYTKVDMPFGWSEVPQDTVYYLHEPTGAVSWDAPEFTFDDEYAARKLQSAYRMLQGRKAFKRMLHTFSFVDLLHASIKHGAGVGWVGFGLEGMSLPVYLSRVGLVKQIPSITKTKLNIESFWTVPDDKWLGLGVVWSKEEKALLATAPRPPLGALNGDKHGFHILPTEKVLTQLLMAHFTGQQGRVQSIVRAFRDLPFPVSYKQLEMYIRGYTGRPAQAAENVMEIVPHGSTTIENEVDLYKLFRHALRRCAIVATNLKLNPLAKRLDHVLHVGRTLPCVKGLWENNFRQSGKLTVAQAALWLRQEGVEFMLQYIRSTVAVQSTYRMHVIRKWYMAVVAHRNYSALTIQLAWRCSRARSVRSQYLAEQTSDYEQHYVEASQLYFFVYVPTQERINVSPVDAYGAPIAYRPVVLDRVTRKLILAWPWLGSSNQAPDVAAGNVFESNVVCSVCDNERASRVCDVCCTSRGDYIYYCFACYCSAHPPALTWHTYQPLNRLQALALRCVECTRLSSHRCLVCKEDYCDRCVARIHSKGKRATHLIEHYEPKSQVCIECEQRVALKVCTVCADALCEDCASRTHARGNKAKHVMDPLLQPLPPGSEHCIQCKSRVADRTCRHCAGPVCHVCLDTSHPALCLDAQFEAAKRVLLGDNVCVDCGKPADRVCETCGDKYCSVRWMGNPGCFERFHAKGKRIEHVAASLDVPPLVLSPEALALEKKVAAHKHAMQAAADVAAKAQEAAEMDERRQNERVQKAVAADVQRAKRLVATEVPPPESSDVSATTPERRTVVFRKPKKQAPRCTTQGCTAEALRKLPFCPSHCTAQNLLAMGHDAKGAARIMAELEKVKGRHAHEAEFGVSLLEKVRREFKDMAFLINEK